jgi:ribose 5-phosphate isomerase B
MNELAIGCDHAGYRLKEFLKENLTGMGYSFRDFGAFSEDSVDYPDIIHPLANAINNNEFDRGIIICGTGIGVSMTANKYPGVRAALCWSMDIVRLAREHNDANVLALPGRFIDPDIALQIALVFLKTSFEGGRHERRVNKITR